MWLDAETQMAGRKIPVFPSGDSSKMDIIGYQWRYNDIDIYILVHSLQYLDLLEPKHHKHIYIYIYKHIPSRFQSVQKCVPQCSVVGHFPLGK